MRFFARKFASSMVKRIGGPQSSLSLVFNGPQAVWKGRARSLRPKEYVFYDTLRNRVGAANAGPHYLPKDRVNSKLLCRGLPLYLTLGFAVGSVTIFCYNWDFVKQRVGREGAEVIREGIQSEGLQLTAASVSKALLQEVLRDEKVQHITSQWITEVLQVAEPELKIFILALLRSDAVLEQVHKISDSVVKHLCSEDWVKQKVADLLLSAINTADARDGATAWVVDLLQRPEVEAALESAAVNNVFNNSQIKAEAEKLACSVAVAILSDPETLAATQKHLIHVLSEEGFQDHASASAWSVLKRVVAPRWLAPFSNASTSKRSSSVPSLTSEAPTPSVTLRQAGSYGSPELDTSPLPTSPDRPAALTGTDSNSIPTERRSGRSEAASSLGGLLPPCDTDKELKSYATTLGLASMTNHEAPAPICIEGFKKIHTLDKPFSVSGNFATPTPTLRPLAHTGCCSAVSGTRQQLVGAPAAASTEGIDSEVDQRSTSTFGEASHEPTEKLHTVSWNDNQCFRGFRFLPFLQPLSYSLQWMAFSPSNTMNIPRKESLSQTTSLRPHPLDETPVPFE